MNELSSFKTRRLQLLPQLLLFDDQRRDTHTTGCRIDQMRGNFSDARLGLLRRAQIHDLDDVSVAVFIVLENVEHHLGNVGGSELRVLGGELVFAMG